MSRTAVGATTEGGLPDDGCFDRRRASCSVSGELTTFLRIGNAVNGPDY